MEHNNNKPNGAIHISTPGAQPEAVQGKPGNRRSNTVKNFSAFMAGAVVVSSLMFASDKMNLFTPVQAAAPAASTSQAGTATTASLDLARPNNIADIAKQAGPAVVKIETKVKASTKQKNNPYLNDPFFRQFFGGGSSSGGGTAPNDTLQPAGIGSGFIFESSGYILTNQHVVDGADEIDVTLQGYDQPFKAKLLGSSYDLDLAVLKIEDSKPFPTLPIGNSDNSKVGEWVVAIGNPYDFDYTVTAGLLSAKERPISIQDEEGTRNYKHLLQTDAAINPGNSGGPLLNMNGEVIGINTAVNSEAQGIGFAIPTSTISSVLDQLKNNVAIPKEAAPYIGVSVQDVTSDMVKDLKLSGTEGAIVADVQMKTPAFDAGIRPYDVIVSVNGTKVANAAALTKQVQAAKVGDKLKVTIVRDGQQQDMTVTVGDRSADSASAQQK